MGIERRQAMISVIQENARKELINILKDERRHKKLLAMLICQGLLAFLEADVTVRCRECDKALVESILNEAAQSYSDVIMNQTGVKKSVQLKLITRHTSTHHQARTEGHHALVVLYCFVK